MEKEVEKETNQRGSKTPLLNTANMNSQIMWYPTQGLNGSAPDRILELKGEVDTCLHP